jgi:hypothetical protein
MSGTPDPRALRYVKYYTLRLEYAPRDRTAEIAATFHCSPEELYDRLAADGFPVCRACGETPATESHCSLRSSGRRALTAGASEELPLAAEAEMLFYGALKTLENAVADLHNRKEYLQDGRFLAQEVYPGGAYWPEKGIDNGTFTAPLGASQSPAEPLTTLIAVYILAGEPIEPLLRKLHLRPDTVDHTQLRRLIEGEKTKQGHKPGLKSRAGQVARIVRGGTLRPGANTGEFDERIQNGSWYRRQLVDRGWDHDSIVKELKRVGFTQSEISQIEELKNIPHPE